MMPTSIDRCLVLPLFFCSAIAGAGLFAQDCETTVAKEEVWLGEPVQLSITLYSPGPFSGTAKFAFPQIADTIVLPKGSPVVGSKNVAGQSLLSQRHGFLVISQRPGKTTIPSFAITYAGKPDFVSDPIEKQTQTQEVSFEVKKPDSFPDSGDAVSAQRYDVTQLWKGADPTELESGQIVTRQITQKIEGSTAIFLTDISSPQIRGIRTYRNTPDVQDKFERGELRGQRIDVVKYRFESAGVYELPEIELRWWSLQKEKMEVETLPGLTITVKEPPQQTLVSEDANGSIWRIALSSTAVLLLATIAVALARNWPLSPQQRIDPAKRVIIACRKNDPQAAYSALLAWSKSCLAMNQWSPELLLEWQSLSQRLYGASMNRDNWDGVGLQQEFRRVLKTAQQSSPSHETTLPPLNF